MPERTELETSPDECPQICAVAFDLDGLMLNTEDVFDIAGRELLRRRNLQMTQEVHHAMLGRRPHEAFGVMIEMLDMTESAEVLFAESREIFFAQLDDVLAPMPGLFDLLDGIEARGLPKAVATSSHRDYLEDLLGRFDLLERFATTLSAEDVVHGKPHPEIYVKTAEALGVPPETMLVLEDSEAGTRAAAAAGAIAVAVPHRHTRLQDFSTARYVVESLADPALHRLIDEAGAG